MFDGLSSIIIGLVALLIVAWIYIFLPAGMAARRNRSQFIWVLISLVGSPILACLILLVLGDTD
jgi:hypothetical protein